MSAGNGGPYSVNRIRPDFPVGAESVPLDIRKIVVLSALDSREDLHLTQKELEKAEVAGYDDGIPVPKFLEAEGIKTLKDLYLVKDAIARKVEDKGYFLATVFVPPQRIARKDKQTTSAAAAPAEPSSSPAAAAPPAEDPPSAATVNWQVLEQLTEQPIVLRRPAPDARSAITVNWDLVESLSSASAGRRGQDGRVKLRRPRGEAAEPAVTVNWEVAGNLPSGPGPAGESEKVDLHLPIVEPTASDSAPPAANTAKPPVAAPPDHIACIFIAKGLVTGQIEPAGFVWTVSGDL